MGDGTPGKKKRGIELYSQELKMLLNITQSVKHWNIKKPTEV